jgi:DNA-binding response OmpR family regulator
MTVNIRPTRCSRRRNPLPDGVSWSRRAVAGADLEFGRFRVLLRRRQLLADGVPVELGTRAFDLLLVLLKARGALVTKEELLSRVWPSVVVSEENVKGSGRGIAQSTGRGPRSHPYGIRPRLPIHWRAAHG